MVVIDDEEAPLGPANDRNHVTAQEFGLLLFILLLPALLLGADFAHADRNLGRPQFRYGGRMEQRLANRNHRSISPVEPVGFQDGRPKGPRLHRRSPPVIASVGSNLVASCPLAAAPSS